MNFQIHKICIYGFSIDLKFGRRLSSYAAKPPLKFESIITIQTHTISWFLDIPDFTSRRLTWNGASPQVALFYHKYTINNADFLTCLPHKQISSQSNPSVGYN